MKLPCILAAIILFVPSAYAEEVKEAADLYCDCASSAQEELKNAMESLKTGDPSGFAAIQPKLEAQIASSQKCFSKLNEKYEDRKTDEEFKQQVTAQIDEQCPMPKMGMPDLAGLAGQMPPQ